MNLKNSLNALLCAQLLAPLSMEAMESIALPGSDSMSSAPEAAEVRERQTFLDCFMNDHGRYLMQVRVVGNDMKRLMKKYLLVNHPLRSFIRAKLERGLCLFRGHSSAVCSAEFNCAGDRIVTASMDGTAKIWDVTSGRCIATLEGHRGDRVDVRSAHFNVVGDKIVTASMDGTAKIWDVATGRCITTLEGHTGWVFSARFNVAGDKIVTASEDRTAKVWSVETGTWECIRILEGHSNRVRSAQFNVAGDRIVTASMDGTAKIWDVISGEGISTLERSHSDVSSAVFNVAGNRIVTASRDGTAKIYDVISGDRISTLEGHTQSVTSAAFNVAGDRVVTASWDYTVKIWDVQSERCIATLKTDRSVLVYSAEFNSAGDRIVTACDDEIAKIWFVENPSVVNSFFECDCTLEQALLLDCIYKSRILYDVLKRKRGYQCEELRFDFNRYPDELWHYYVSMPEVIQACLNPFVIRKKDNGHRK